MKQKITKTRALGWSLAVILALALALGACSSMFQQPRVHLTGVHVGGLGLRGATLVAELTVVNPNRFDLETRSFTYDLEVSDPDSDDGWVEFAKGKWDERLRVQSGDSVMVEIPVEFGYSQLGGAIRSMMDHGTFNYRVAGEVEVRDPVNRTVPYRHQGKFTLSGGRE